MKKWTMQVVLRPIAVCLVAIAVLYVGPAAGAQTPSTFSSRQLQDKPQLLNDNFFLMRQFENFAIQNQTITRADFEKVKLLKPSLQNVTFVACNFTNSQFVQGTFRNVTFKDCRFDESQFAGSIFDNVSFIGGSIAMLRVTPDDAEYVREMFEQLTFLHIRNDGQLLLDGVKLREAQFLSLKGGSLTLKNLTDFTYDPKYSRMVDGGNTVVRIENCTVTGVETIASLDGESGIYITDSTIHGGQVDGSSGGNERTNLYAENSWLIDGFDTERLHDIVVRNSDFGGRLHAENDIFLVDTRFMELKDTSPAYPTVSGKKVYIQGGGAPAGAVHARGKDELHIADLRVKTLSVSGTLTTLDLYNLKLDNLHFNDGVDLKGGRWENVAVRSPMKAASPGVYTFGAVTVHNTIVEGGGHVIDARRGASPDASSSQKYMIEMKTSEESVPQPNLSIPTLKELGMDR